MKCCNRSCTRKPRRLGVTDVLEIEVKGTGRDNASRVEQQFYEMADRQFSSMVPGLVKYLAAELVRTVADPRL